VSCAKCIKKRGDTSLKPAAHNAGVPAGLLAF